MKKLSFLILLALLPVVASAYDAYIGGIYYNLSDDEAEVTYKNYDKYADLPYISTYSGDIVIPSSISYGGKTYSVTSIGACAFMGCSVSTVTIPESVTNIGGNAFYKCENIVSVIIPGSVKSIDECAFIYCNSLKSLTIGNGVTRIGNGAFSDCSSLVSVDIPNSVNSIEANAFAECKNLSGVTIPGGVANIGRNAFYGCTNLTSLTIDGGVKSIGEIAFAGCTSLSSVTIPESVTNIGAGAFSDCTMLASVTVPESVVSVGALAFNGTAWLNKQSQGVVYVGGVAYKYKGEMPEGTEISIREGTVQIADEAFIDCTGLTSITIPESLTNIGSSAFSGCKGLTSITLPESVTNIGNAAFGGCSSLTSITLPSSVTNIGKGTFRVCTSLTSVIMPDGVRNIGDEAFDDCISLTSITIPESVTSIGDFAFFGCKNLTSIVIPNNVTNIGVSAFCQCESLATAVLPNSLKEILGYALGNCDNLKDVYCYAENVPQTESKLFYESPISVATLHVPEASVEKYQKSSPWSGFGNIVALAEEPSQPLSFLEGNPIWVFKYEHIPRGFTWKNDHWERDCWVDTGNRYYTYYFLGGSKEIEGKVYTMMGVVTSNGEKELTVNRWLPVREEDGIVYAITDSLPGVDEYIYDDELYPIPYLQQGNECVLYNFNTEIGEALFPQNEWAIVESYSKFQLMDGTECRVLKTHWEYWDLYEKLGFLNDGQAYGVMDPFCGMLISTDGHVYVKHLNAYYQDNTMLYKAPDAPDGLCVNDTCWTFDDAHDYAISYKADPHHEEVMAYIRQLQAAAELVTFTKDQMATIILPTAPDASKGKYYKLDRLEDGQIIFTQETQPQARTPYIIMPSEDFSIDMSTLDVAGLSPDTVTVGGISFIGSYVRTILPALTGGDGGGSSSSYYDIIDTTSDCLIAQLGAEMSVVGALRAYLMVQWDDPINHGGPKGPSMEKMGIIILDYGTSIDEIQNSKFETQNDGEIVNCKSSNSKCFDLSGRCVGNGNLKPGIYVVNGMKILVK